MHPTLGQVPCRSQERTLHLCTQVFTVRAEGVRRGRSVITRDRQQAQGRVKRTGGGALERIAPQREHRPPLPNGEVPLPSWAFTATETCVRHKQLLAEGPAGAVSSSDLIPLLATERVIN